MKVILKNNSSDDFVYSNQTITVPANGSLNIDSCQWFNLYSDTNFLKDVRNNNLVISDGLNDLTMPKSEEYISFVNNFDYNNKDIDGASIVRLKAAKKGWSFWAVPIETTTSTLNGSLFCKTFELQDIPGISCKIYDENDNEITEAGVDNVNLNSCVKTVIDFEPEYDFEIIGGEYRVNQNPEQDFRVWIIGAPDIPAIYGGSKEFISGINIKFLAPDSAFFVDGRVTKYFTYNSDNHQGKVRTVMRHLPGSQVNTVLILHVYRK